MNCTRFLSAARGSTVFVAEGSTGFSVVEVVEDTAGGIVPLPAVGLGLYPLGSREEIAISSN